MKNLSKGGKILINAVLSASAVGLGVLQAGGGPKLALLAGAGALLTNLAGLFQHKPGHEPEKLR